MKPLTYRNYYGSVETDMEDEILHGSIQFINDLVTYEAADIPSLKKAFEDAVNDYLTTCAEIGKQPDKPCSGQFNVRTKPELHRRAQLRALQEGTTLNAVVVCALESYLGESSTIQNHHHTHEVTVRIPQEVLTATATASQDLKIVQSNSPNRTEHLHVKH